MPVTDDPRALGALLGRLVDDGAVERVQHAMGRAGKDTVLGVARKHIGADLRFSGMIARKPRAKLGAGYDLETDTSVTLSLRPKGLWYLANDGRTRTKRINPRNGQALATPQGPRAHSTSTPSRGLGTLDQAFELLDRNVAEAAAAQMADNIAQIGF